MPVRIWRKPLDSDKIRRQRGKVHIIEERCKECGFCIEFCPKKVLEKSAKFNKKGYHPPRVVNEENCVSCGFCEIICPDFAIFNTIEEHTEKNAECAEKQDDADAHEEGKIKSDSYIGSSTSEPGKTSDTPRDSVVNT